MKRLLNILMMFLLVTVFAAGLNVKDADAAATKIASSEDYTIGTTRNGALTYRENERAYYKFTLDESGKINLTGSAYMRRIRFYIYDSEANEIWNDSYYWNSTSEVITLDFYHYLTSGTYYLCVCRDDYDGNFDFKIDFTSSNETFKETNGGSNNLLATANTVMTNGMTYKAQIARNDKKDFWKFKLDQSGCVEYNVTFFNLKRAEWKLYDENGQELLNDTFYWNDTTRNIIETKWLNLTSGTYYISISEYDGWNGRYEYSLNYTSANETYPEVNGGSDNTMADANNLSLGNIYTGQLAVNDYKDFYKFTIPSGKPVKISLNSGMEWMYLHLYNTNGTELWYINAHRNSTTNMISDYKIITLESGTYYLVAERDGDRTGNYTVRVDEVTRSNCPHESYSSVWHDATYFARGYRVYTCDVCGYSYKADYIDKLKLPQGYLYYYSSYVGKRSITPVWSTVGDATGYQIRYSTKKSSKGAKIKTVKGTTKSKLKISKLKKNKWYYVSVRPYKKSGKKTAYGAWSSWLGLKAR